MKYLALLCLLVGLVGCKGQVQISSSPAAKAAQSDVMVYRGRRTTEVREIEFKGRRYHVFQHHEGLFVIDVTEQANPKEVLE